MTRIARWLCAALLCAVMLPVRAAQAELSAATAQEVAKIDDSLTKIAKLYRARKFRDAGKLLQETESAVNALALQLSDDERAELKDRLNDWQRRSEAAKRLLAAKKGASAGGAGISFVKDVAPLLVANCAGCHIRDTKGGFSIANFEALARGSENGTVLFPGDGQSSRLYEVLENGDMPRGGNRLPDEALKTVRAWIDEGAKFDGPDQKAALVDLVKDSGSTPSTTPAPALTRPTGGETVSFASEIAGIFVEHCLECHGANNNPRGNLNLATFQRVLAGGDTGALFAPGKPEESLLVGKLKGTAGGARMPMGRDPLPDDVIAKVEKWIAEGGTFDGADATTPLREVWESALAAKLSGEELSAKRVELAGKHWKLALPDAKPKTVESKSYYVIGNSNEAALKEIAAAAEAQQNKIAAALRVQRGKEWFKGRVTVFVFDRRVEYTEFAEMVESRGVPQDVAGHWKYSALDPYVCIVLPPADATETSASVRPLIAIQLAGLGIAEIGETPLWFSHGLARAITSRVEGKDPGVRTWDSLVPQAVAATQNAEMFLRADASTGNNSLAAYAFCKTLLEDGGRYGRLIGAMRKGEPFDTALSDTYGLDAKSLLERWAADRAQGQ